MGGADSTLFAFDPKERNVAADTTALPQAITKMLASQDGWTYGLTENRFFRANPDLTTIQTIDEDEGWWDSLVEIDDGRSFTSRGPALYEVVR